jgi:hypothetical protein
MAAATAAIVGSQLGVAGTVFGAAVGSVASAIAGTIYQVGIEKTHHQLKHLATAGTQRVRGIQPTPQARAEVVPVDGGPAFTNAETPTAPLSADDAHSLTVDGPIVDGTGAEGTPAVPTVDPGATTLLPADGVDASAESAPDAGTSADAQEDDAQPTRRHWTVIVGAPLASAAAAFAIGFGAITGYEALTGRSVSGGQGTTIGQIADGAQARRSPQPSATPTGAESQTVPSSSATPTQSESQPESSTQPSSEPTTTQTTTPSSEPTPSATQATPTSNTSPTAGTSPAGLSKSSSTTVATASATQSARSVS